MVSFALAYLSINLPRTQHNRVKGCFKRSSAVLILNVELRQVPGLGGSPAPWVRSHRDSNLFATILANLYSPARSEMRGIYSGAETWLLRWVRPNCWIALSALQGNSRVMWIRLFLFSTLTVSLQGDTNGGSLGDDGHILLPGHEPVLLSAIQHLQADRFIHSLGMKNN